MLATSPAMAWLVLALLAILRAADAQDVFIPSHQLRGSATASIDVPAKSTSPPRRLWVCPRGYVGKDQCDASHYNSHCCGYSVPGENCGDRTDCFCYQWNCNSPLPSWEVLAKLENSAEVASSGIEHPAEPNSTNSTGAARRLWVCPRGFVGKDQCDASHYNSHCCGYSVPGENCGDRTDCFCYQWNCNSPLPSWEVLPKLENSEEAASSGIEHPAEPNSTGALETSAEVASNGIEHLAEPNSTGALETLASWWCEPSGGVCGGPWRLPKKCCGNAKCQKLLGGDGTKKCVEHQAQQCVPRNGECGGPGRQTLPCCAPVLSCKTSFGSAVMKCI